MAKRKTPDDITSDAKVADYRYESKRKNIPPAGLAAQGKIADLSTATIPTGRRYCEFTTG